MSIGRIGSSRRLPLALALGLASSSLAFAGCGGASAALDPVASAATRSQQAGTADMTFSATFSSPGLAGGKSFTLSGSGLVGARQAELTFDMSRILQQAGAPPGTDATFEEIFVDQGGDYVLYMRMGLLGPLLGGKHWLKIDASKVGRKLGFDFGKLAGGQTTQDPSQLLDLLRATSGEVDDLGAETIDGTPTTHYRATVDLAKAAKVDGISDQTLQQLTQAGAPTTIPEDVWIGSDGLVRRFRLSYAMTSSGVPLRMTITIGLGNYGTAASITAPPEADVYDASELVLQGLGKQSSLPSS
jgi:hypothetical protein